MSTMLREIWPFWLRRYRVEYDDHVTRFEIRRRTPKVNDVIDTPDGPMTVLAIPLLAAAGLPGTITAEPVAPPVETPV